MALFELNIEQWLEKRGEFEVLIDVRSPHEYAYSHIKDALNLYALDDAEHKEVGILMRRSSVYQDFKLASFFKPLLDIKLK